MNIDYLKTFQEIARLGSFSEVAKRLHVTQPAVSFQVQKLEQELGVKLIDRSQRSVELTEAGKRLLRFAQAVEGERDKMHRDLENMREEISGDLHIGASTIPGEYILPSLLAKFKSLHPAVTIQVDIFDSLRVVEQIRENDYELGFCGVVPEGLDLQYFKMAGDEIVLITHVEHPFANKQNILREDLEGEPFIFREATSGTQRSLENLLEKSGVSSGKLSPQLVLGSTQAVISAVAAGAGIAFISSLALKFGCSPLVKQVKVRGLQLNRDFYCVFRRDKVINRLNGEFKNFIQIETAPHD
jgi:LysR family transcriptional regulator, transcriptional activator of the cysJI operon